MSLAGLTMLVLAAALTPVGLNAEVIAGWLGFELGLAGATLLYAGTGRLVTSRMPGTAIGWLLGLIGLLVAAEMLAEQYTIYGLITAPGSLPAARLAGWFAEVVTYLTVFLLLLVLLFPDGRLPSPRWRPVRAAILVVMAGSVVSQMQAGTFISGLTDVLEKTGASYPNPLGPEVVRQVVAQPQCFNEVAGKAPIGRRCVSSQYNACYSIYTDNTRVTRNFGESYGANSD